MNNNILITTTNNIEGARIENYFELISTNIVVGTNFFSDLSASITDIFGGLSETYQNKLQKIYQIALNDLRIKAKELNANAIIGLKIDFDEISGKGKSMFMVSAIGTPIRLKYQERTIIDKKSSLISSEDLQKEFNKRLIIEKVNKEIIPNKEDWEFLLNNPIPEISEKLLIMYVTAKRVKDYEMGIEDSYRLLFRNISLYFKNLDNTKSSEILYSHIKDNPKLIITLIDYCKLFSPYEILKLLKEKNINTAIICLTIDKSIYTKEDLKIMKEIISTIDSLPDSGKIDLVKKTIGKAKEKYICENGHINDSDEEYCDTCGVNIKGLKKGQMEIINNFKIKTISLDSLLNEN